MREEIRKSLEKMGRPDLMRALYESRRGNEGRQKEKVSPRPYNNRSKKKNGDKKYIK